MTLLQMSYILEVDRCGSMNRAAQNLFLSQSALSAAIAEVERELGVTVFLRTNRGVTLMLGSDAGTESAGWCKAVDGQLFMAETADELDAAGYVAYTLNSDGTMSWTDDDGQLSGQLTAQEQELIAFPMVWTKLA